MHQYKKWRVWFDMSTKSENALKLFSSGLNCSQSVLVSFCESYGLSRESALKIACGFGGGIRSGDVCGAVSGAVMVIGLKYGNSDITDLDSKRNCYMQTSEFLKLFREKNGSIVCRDLLGCDISTESGMKQAKDKGLFTTVCVDLVKDAIELLENLGY
jgi:C_GCAxxG_C_C family probable redox protein